MSGEPTRRRYRKHEPTKVPSAGTPKWAWMLVVVGIVAIGYMIVTVFTPEDGTPTASRAGERTAATASVAGATFELRITGDGMAVFEALAEMRSPNPNRKPQPLSYRGNISVVGSGGSESRSINGRTPETLNLTGRIVSAVIQKDQEYGHLKVELLKNGTVVKSAETSTAYGVVSVSSN